MKSTQPTAQLRERIEDLTTHDAGDVSPIIADNVRGQVETALDNAWNLLIDQRDGAGIDTLKRACEQVEQAVATLRVLEAKLPRVNEDVTVEEFAELRLVKV